MKTRSASILMVWLTALAVAVQGVGAVGGGFLCIGCPNTTTGVSVASAPCNDADACCANEVAVQTCSDSCSDHEDHDQPQDCGCVDVAIPVHASAYSLPPVKLILSFVAYANPVAELSAWTVWADEPPPYSWMVRGGPPLVRLLAPSSRCTVLLI